VVAPAAGRPVVDSVLVAAERPVSVQAPEPGWRAQQDLSESPDPVELARPKEVLEPVPRPASLRLGRALFLYKSRKSCKPSGF
jgi:hypothetical protein